MYRKNKTKSLKSREKKDANYGCKDEGNDDGKVDDNCGDDGGDGVDNDGGDDNDVDDVK